jgi:hypothetical protein
MIEYVFVFGAMGLGARALWTMVRQWDRRDWATVVAQAGLEDVRADGWADLPAIGSFGPSVLVRGRVGRQEVRIDRAESGLRVVVECRSGITLRPEREVPGAEREATPELSVGDPAFDRAFWILGPEDVLRAVLDTETRRAVLRLFEEPILDDSRISVTRIAVRDGDLGADVREDRPGGLKGALPELLAKLLPVAARLERPANILERLVENAGKETDGGVRRETVAFLTGYGRQPLVLDALHRACRDPREDVRLEAALGLGRDGQGTLREIARLAASDALGVRAVQALGVDLTFDDALASLERARRTRHLRTAVACIEALGRLRGPEVTRRLANVLTGEAGGLAVAAARALGATGDPTAEPVLLEALAESKEMPLRIAAADALGAVGTAEAVPALQEAGEGLWDRPLRKAAREAIVQIQSRLGGASPGQLSLVEGEDAEGRLSLVDGSQGRVSLPPRPETDR